MFKEVLYPASHTLLTVVVHRKEIVIILTYHTLLKCQVVQSLINILLAHLKDFH